MDQLKDLALFSVFPTESLPMVIVNFLICMCMLTIVGWFYKRFSRSLGGKMHVGSILPLIGLTVFLIIVVVKSSLALSLGLVGALSIVRFRTPIKEPEELGYIFLTIAIGLGFAANFKVITMAVTSCILVYLWFSSKDKGSLKQTGEHTLIVSWHKDIELSVDDLNQAVSKVVLAFKINRLEQTGSKLVGYYSVTFDEKSSAQLLITELNSLGSGIEFQMIESGVNW
ncbi:DUF4956 domain-containing protein [Planktomarina sp.]|nr:DUF4956 domain-containing protein [Planktomarina sp.]